MTQTLEHRYNFNSSRVDVLEKLTTNRGLREASRILNALRIIHVEGRPEQTLAMLAWAVDHAARLHGALVTAEICPPVSPGLLHSPGVDMMKNKRDILASFEVFPEWNRFDSANDREQVRDIIMGCVAFSLECLWKDSNKKYPNPQTQVQKQQHITDTSTLSFERQ